ncbi:class I SAM-dependent methyltransferase [bacterium]|nr:class I SAM-dependent methyltransferase [bacterium]
MMIFIFQLKLLIKRIVYFGFRNNCPICNSNIRYFKRDPVSNRPDAYCPVCGAYERHRFAWYFLYNSTDLFNKSPKKILHIAPNPIIREKLSNQKQLLYIYGDLSTIDALVTFDLVNLPFSDNRFDIIICSHILEHIPNDHKAINEIFRVLKRNGFALIAIPITAEKTYEDPTVTTSEDRLKKYGQVDHVRRYGFDFIDRLKKSGFMVKTISSIQINNEIRNKHMFKEQHLFYCIKE